jgi:hypothetical protein
MTAQKQAEPVQAKLPTDRKPWKKKSPVEVVIAQIDRVREDVTKRGRRTEGRASRTPKARRSPKASRVQIALSPWSLT